MKTNLEIMSDWCKKNPDYKSLHEEILKTAKELDVQEASKTPEQRLGELYKARIGNE